MFILHPSAGGMLTNVEMRIMPLYLHRVCLTLNGFFYVTPCLKSSIRKISCQCSVLRRSENLIHGRSLLALGTLAMAYLVFVVKITDELKALKSIFKPAVWILELLKKIKKVLKIQLLFAHSFHFLPSFIDRTVINKYYYHN